MADTSSFGLGEIGQIAVTVKDLPKAVAYYRDVLGMEFLFDAPNLAFFKCGGVRLMLGLPEGEIQPGTSILYFKVDDIRFAHQALADRGVQFIHEPQVVHRTDEYELWLAFFRDLDGNPLALMSEVR
jgi:catechol 2,3-dioxygenase-like lactoylglutathione lyase family enzyme